MKRALEQDGTVTTQDDMKKPPLEEDLVDKDHLKRLVRSEIGPLVYTYPGFTLHGSVGFVNLIEWEPFPLAYALLFPGQQWPARVEEKDSGLFFDALFLTAVKNSIKNHYGSFEVQIYLHSQGTRRALEVIELDQKAEHPLLTTKAAGFARAVIEALQASKAPLIMVERSGLSLRYHNIWDEAKSEFKVKLN